MRLAFHSQQRERSPAGLNMNRIDPLSINIDGLVKSRHSCHCERPARHLPAISCASGAGRRVQSNLLQYNYLNLRACFVVEFILSIAEGLLAMTGEKTFYEFVKID